MLRCPLCQTEYRDVTKVCPLKHCSNCGSLDLQTYKKRSFKSARAKQNFLYLIPPVGFFVLVYGYLFVQGDVISFLSIVAVYTIFFLGILSRSTQKNINCQQCNARNFPYVTDINLNPIKKESTIDDKDLTAKIAKTVLEGLSKEQKKHNKKDMTVRILGAICLITIAILGTFFVKPDNALVGEIIDLIKSFQG